MIRMSKSYLEAKWSNGETIKLRGKSYRVGHMSYGEYFIEPIAYAKKATENDYHSNDTLWPRKELRDNGVFTGNYLI